MKAASETHRQLHALALQMPEPFDYEQLWQALTPDQREAIPIRKAEYFVHLWSTRRFIKRVSTMTTRKKARYRRASNFSEAIGIYRAAIKPAVKETQLSPTELAWRAFRSEMQVPEVPEISVHSLTIRHQ